MPISRTVQRIAVLCLAPGLLLVARAASPTGATPAAGDNPAKPKPAAEPATKPAKPAKDEYQATMDYGAFLSTSVLRSAADKPYKPVPPAPASGSTLPIDPIPDVVALKGVVVRVGRRDGPAGTDATVCFDTDALRVAGGWTGGWLDLSGTMLTNHKGTSDVALAGAEQFRCDGVGWGGGKVGGDFDDPRPNKMGPLPPERGRYNGLYVHGDDVVFSYSVGGVDVLDWPAWDVGTGVFTRHIRVEAHDRPMTMAVCNVPGGTAELIESGHRVIVTAGDEVTALVLIHPPPFSSFRFEAGQVRVQMPNSFEAERFTVAITKGRKVDLPDIYKRFSATSGGFDPKSLCAGGPAHWKPAEAGLKAAATARPAAPAAGAKAAGDDPGFVVDNVPMPADNPYHSWLRLTGLDFFPDGRAAVCTLNGDVWVVSGLDDKLDHVSWTRFATGLYHPMGLRVVDGKVCVRGRDQLTRLHDLNGDGEADFYENVNNEGMAHPSYHGFVFDLQTDADGNFYYARGGIGMDPELPGHGRLTKVSKDGSTVTTTATGLRAPNGLGSGPGGPHGWVTVSDNQGNWIPSSRITMIDPSQNQPPFLGFVPAHHMDAKPTAAAPPLVWLPHTTVDNSSGGQAYVSSDKWGPFAGQWVHTSFGKASVMLMLPDYADVDVKPGTPAPMPAQAAVVKLPLSFATGVMRPRFNPADGQLYLCGVGGGWQTAGTADGGLYRVRHTGRPSRLPCAFRVLPHGLRLTFASPLDKAAAADEQNWAVEQWNYQWSEKYGSPDLSVKNPGKAGHDAVDVKAVTVSDDGRTVTLDVPGLAPVMQMTIEYKLKAADGAAAEGTVYATINRVPGK